MNTHLDEGTLQALLDGELPPGERVAAEAHLAACGECAAEARALRALNERAAALIGLADAPAPVAQAQMALRARRLSAGRWREARNALLRAAVLVLAVAGVAAAAVPGSPVREWLVNAVVPAPRAPAADAHAPAASPAVVAAPPEAPSGVFIQPEDGAVRVVLRGAAPGVKVTARLVDGGRAGVLARGAAAAGARFRTAPGRIEMVGAGAGVVEVEIPRSAKAAIVEVNGRVYAAKSGDALRVNPAASAEGASTGSGG